MTQKTWMIIHTYTGIIYSNYINSVLSILNMLLIIFILYNVAYKFYKFFNEIAVVESRFHVVLIAILGT